ncbi:MAG: hypothetical protein ACE5IP_02765 [Terriglobia bacterium]
MRILDSLTTGLQRILASPGVLIAAYLVGVVVAAPLAVAMGGILKQSIGSSLVDEKLTRGFDLDWYGEFSDQSSGLAETFSPSVVGFLSVLTNVEKLLDGELLPTQSPLLLAGVAVLLGWAFLAGGILDRYAQPEGWTPRSQFFAQCGEYFFRFVRLQVLLVLLYWALLRWVGKPLHDWVEEITRDVTRESTGMLYRLGAYLAVMLLLLLLGITSDYAKITMVAERRRSALLAFLRALRLVLSRPGPTLGLYLLLALVGGALLLFYGAVAPGPNQSTWTSVVFAFLVGQVYLLARVFLKLWFLASQTRLFQVMGGRTA